MKQLILASTLAVAATLGSLGGCAVTSGQSSVGEYVDDAAISTRVRTRFAQDPKVSLMRLDVNTLNGVVQLSGFATSQEEKDRAAQLARSVPDVRGVRNDIVVRPPQQ